MRRRPLEDLVPLRPDHQVFRHRAVSVEELRGILFRHIWTGALGTFWYTVFEPTGLYFSFFALHFLSKAQMGILATVASAAVVFQFLSADAERHYSRKYAWYILAIVSRISFVLLVFLPPEYISLPLILLLVFLGMALSHIASPLWMSWVYQMIPEQYSGRFWAKRMRGITMISLLLTLAAGAAMDRVPDRMFFVRFVFLAAIVLGVVDIIFHVRIPEPPSDEQTATVGVSDFLTPLRSPASRRWILANAFFAFSVSISSCFSVPFMLKDLHLEGFVANTIIIFVLPSVATVVLLNRWGKMVDTKGPRAVVLTRVVTAVILPLVYYASTPANGFWMMAISWSAVGALWVAAEQASGPRINASLSRGMRRSAYVAVLTVACTASGGIGSLLGSWIVSSAGIRAAFLVSSSLRAVAAAVFFRMPFGEIAKNGASG